MRTRKDKIDDHYIKDIPQNEKQNIIKQIPEPEIKTSLSPYKKKLSNSRTYYKKNKETIINRVKEYNKSIPKEEVAKKRILYYLNGDESYRNRIKQTTLDKHKIQYIDGVYV